MDVIFSPSCRCHYQEALLLILRFASGLEQLFRSASVHKDSQTLANSTKCTILRPERKWCDYCENQPSQSIPSPLASNYCLIRLHFHGLWTLGSDRAGNAGDDVDGLVWSHSV